jgi:hypothetical protein
MLVWTLNEGFCAVMSFFSDSVSVKRRIAGGVVIFIEQTLRVQDMHKHT